MRTADEPVWHDVREEEVPAHVWDFQLWLKRYWDEQGEPKVWNWVQYQEIVAEAKSRGILINWDGVIEYGKH